jgi:hypothetical protein
MKIPEEIWHMRHVARYTSLVLEISPYFGADRGASIGQEWSAVGRGVDFDAAVVGAGGDASGTGKWQLLSALWSMGEARLGGGFDWTGRSSEPAGRQRYGGNGCDNFALRNLSFRSTCLTTRGGR